MGMVIRTNVMALNSNNALNKANGSIAGSMEKLSTGFRINKAADDASGLSISEKMKAQIKALDTAVDNCEDGANMIQTAEGYMAETQDMLNRMVELAEKSANGVLDNTDRDALQDEMNQLCAEIDRIATTANFNGSKLMDGSLGSNGVVEIVSNQDGAQYSLSANAPQAERYSVADDGVAAAKLTLSDDQKATLADMAIAKAESDAVTEGEAEDTYTFYVNANGDILAPDDEGNDPARVTTDGAYAADTNPDGWDKVTVTVTEATTDPTAATVNDGITLQIGESSTAADRLDVSINSFHTDSLLGGVKNFSNEANDDTNMAAKAVADTTANSVSTYANGITVDITDKDKASAAADALRQVSNFVSDERGKMGALQNRLEHTVNNLTTASENTSAANSRIRDTDMAKEMIKYTSTNVITQAAQAMLAQANTQPQNVLQLLQ